MWVLHVYLFMTSCLNTSSLCKIHGPGFSIRSIEHLTEGLADAYDAGLTKAGLHNHFRYQILAVKVT